VAIERALISVYDKTGAVEFARDLALLGIEIISTGGTAKLLRDAHVPVLDIADLTGWPEMLGGRVKTLHPKVHGGILFQRGKEDDRKQAREHGIVPIDLVVVNLYPFSATAAKPGVTPEELIENIDIGGPAMIRSAAKNFHSVGVVTDPSDYTAVAAELRSRRELSLPTRLALARKAYARTARYDGEIATELERLAASPDVGLGQLEALPARVHIALERRQTMRYGENPHQSAALYVPAGRPAAGLAGAKQIQGKELSYNNLVDIDAARALVEEFRNPAVAIIKHNNPAGCAEQETLRDAYLKALACDPVSAFGGVIAVNRVLDASTAEEIAFGSQEKFARAGNAERGSARRAGAETNCRRRAGSGSGPARVARSRAESCHRARAYRGGTAKLAVCVEGFEAREVECHRFRARRANAGRWRGANEPRRFGEDCGD
jgi:phosphoribosylaminoimidazolecarboxamide formyltransferase/IMP cyclohydrolase